METKFENHFAPSLRIPLAMLAFLSFLGLPIAAAQDPGPDAGPSAAASQAPGATLSQYFSPPKAPEVGDRLLLKLDVTHPLNTTVHLPEAFPNPRWELANREQLRSEEHTSELQSRPHLVCRLLL